MSASSKKLKYICWLIAQDERARRRIVHPNHIDPMKEAVTLWALEEIQQVVGVGEVFQTVVYMRKNKLKFNKYSNNKFHKKLKFQTCGWIKRSGSCFNFIS